MAMQNFWKFLNQASEANQTITAKTSEKKTAELIIYGDIVDDKYWDEEVSAKSFSDDLKALGEVDEIVVRINSYGGSVFAAYAIYARLRDHPAKITVKIDGIAASAASIIAMAGDTIQIPKNGFLMIHAPMSMMFGLYNSEKLKEKIAYLERIGASIVSVYTKRTGKTADEINEIMNDQSKQWIIGEEAVAQGFCDELMLEEVQAVATAYLDRFNNIPDSLAKQFNAQNKVNKEKSEKPIVKGEKAMTLEELKAQHPDLVNQIENSAVKTERERIKAIEEMSLDGFEDVVNKAKFDEPKNAADVALAIVNAQKKQGKNWLDNRQQDVQNSGMLNVKPSENIGVENSKTKDEDIDAILAKIEKEEKGE